MWHGSPVTWWELHVILSAALWQQTKSVIVTLFFLGIYLHPMLDVRLILPAIYFGRATQDYVLKMIIVRRAYTGWKGTVQFTFALGVLFGFFLMFFLYSRALFNSYSLKLLIYFFLKLLFNFCWLSESCIDFSVFHKVCFAGMTHQAEDRQPRAKVTINLVTIAVWELFLTGYFLFASYNYQTSPQFNIFLFISVLLILSFW